VLRGGDVIGSAQTGTGKTAAFALPIIQRLGGHGPLRCLILEPTRELALQVEEAFQKFAKFTDLRVTIVYGGVGYGKQTSDLQRGMDILAATPGRLLDHLEQGNCALDQIEILVLDEVDRMLDMGFLPDVRRIVQKCPKARQTLFFTATLPPEIEQLASWALRDPVKVEIGRTHSPAETVAHAFYPVVASQKFDLLQLLLDQTDFKSVLIFSRTRMGADRIAHKLQTKGHSVGVMHSDRNQRERIEALEGFKSGKFEVLVATDIAARGLDIAGVSHVINYDVPENPEDYVHRIGRTGRAGAEGDSLTFLTPDDGELWGAILKELGTAQSAIQVLPGHFGEGGEDSHAEVSAPAVSPAPQGSGDRHRSGGGGEGRRSGGGQYRGGRHQGQGSGQSQPVQAPGSGSQRPGGGGEARRSGGGEGHRQGQDGNRPGGGGESRRSGGGEAHRREQDQDHHRAHQDSPDRHQRSDHSSRHRSGPGGGPNSGSKPGSQDRHGSGSRDRHGNESRDRQSSYRPETGVVGKVKRWFRKLINP